MKSDSDTMDDVNRFGNPEEEKAVKDPSTADSGVDRGVEGEIIMLFVVMDRARLIEETVVEASEMAETVMFFEVIPVPIDEYVTFAIGSVIDDSERGDTLKLLKPMLSVIVWMVRFIETSAVDDSGTLNLVLDEMMLLEDVMLNEIPTTDDGRAVVTLELSGTMDSSTADEAFDIVGTALVVGKATLMEYSVRYN